MSKQEAFPIEVTHMVRDTCLCLATQRAARALSRRFDDVFRPFGITSGQFSLMTALTRPKPWRISDLARLLAMDRTTVTANLKPLVRDGLAVIATDKDDGRSRNVTLTARGRTLLKRALPIWQETHREIDRLLSRDTGQLRSDLAALVASYSSE